MFLGRKRLLIINALLQFFVLLLYFEVESDYRPNIVICSLMIGLIQYCCILRAIPNNIVRPSVVFLFTFFIVNMQSYLDLVLGYIDENEYLFVNSNTINKAALIAASGFISFVFGYFLIKVKLNVQTFSGENTKYNAKMMNFFLTIFFLCFIFWFSSLTVADFTGESYKNSGSFDSSATSYQSLLYNICLIVTLSYLSKKYPNNVGLSDFWGKFPKLLLVLLTAYVLIKLMSGDRGGAVFTMFIVFFFYLFITKKKFNPFLFLLSIFFGAIIMTSISLSRGMGSQISFVDKVTYVFDNKELIAETPSCMPMTRELSGSVKCLHVALNEIENRNEPYHYGLFHFCYLLNCIPFVGSYLQDVLNIPKTHRISSEYITVADSGEFYNYGLGTSILADNYLDFGIWGVILSLIIIGAIFRYVDEIILFGNSKYLSIYYIIFSFVFCFSLVTMPRGYFGATFKNFIYAAILFYLLKNMYQCVVKFKHQ